MMPTDLTGLIATNQGLATLSRESGEALCCVSLYLLCLVLASLLAYRLHRYTDPGDPIGICELWRRSWRVSGCVAAGAGLLLLLPASSDWIPDNWRGQNLFAPDQDQHILTPGMAESATLETRRLSIAALVTTIASGVVDQLPEKRRDIDWVAASQWQVPGIPGHTYEYSVTRLGFEVREPVSINGEQLTAFLTESAIRNLRDQLPRNQEDHP